MRLSKKVVATLVLATGLLHVSGNESVAATNCGFLTVEQCKATASGLGSLCVPNQFYNPQRSAKTPRKRQDFPPTRGPTILIRGAPNFRTMGAKLRKSVYGRRRPRVNY